MGLFERAAEAVTRAFAPPPIESAVRAAPSIVTTPLDKRPIRQRIMGAPGRSRRGQPEALDADIRKCQAIFAEAETGRTARLIDLGKDARARDRRLNAVCNTRILQVQGRIWMVEPPPDFEEDPVAIQVAADVTTSFKEVCDLKTLLGHLAHGSLEPHAVLEHVWGVNRRGWYVSQPEWRHPNRFGWNADLKICKVDPGEDNWPGIPLETWPAKFIVHSPVAGMSDYPWRRGALRSCIISSIVKRKGIVWWLTMLERWGQPQVFATLGENESEDAEDTVLAGLRALGSDWRAVMPKGVTLTPIEVTVSETLHKEFVQWADTQDAIAILGQDLTTEAGQGGSYAAAKIANTVRYDILQADIDELSETVTSQWVRPLVEYNWPGAPVPVFRLLATVEGAITTADFQARLYTKSEARASNGYDPPADGSGDQYYEGGTALGIGIGPDGAPSLVTGPSAAPTEKVADAALNGAQVASLKEIVQDVAAGLIPRDAGIAMIVLAFQISSEEATALMGTAGAGFVPSGSTDAPGGTPAAPPLPSTIEPMSPTAKSALPMSSPSRQSPLGRALLRR